MRRLARLALLRILGFDAVHAFRNRHAILDADCVWTHTEENWLAVASLLAIRPRSSRPRILGQSVWLWDRWANLGFVRRWTYRYLSTFITVHTTLSTINRDAARRHLGPGAQVMFVPFGIEPITPTPLPARKSSSRSRVLAIGNDRHRDWDLLVATAQLMPSVDFVVASKSYSTSAASRDAPSNVTPIKTSDTRDLLGQYEAADVVFIPLTNNLHASGITVALEAGWAGRPVVCADAGGLRDYFPTQSVQFYQTGNIDDAASKLAQTLEHASERSPEQYANELLESGLSGHDYALRHVLLTEDLLGGNPLREEVSAITKVCPCSGHSIRARNADHQSNEHA